MKTRINHSITTFLVSSGVALASMGSASGVVLYGISSFNNSNSTSGTADFIEGITTISTVADLTGTTEAQLLALQTIKAAPLTTVGGSDRFRNSESPHNNTRGTLTTDSESQTNGGYFQFGIDANDGFAVMTSDLMFDAVRATTGTSERGYRIEMSIDGGGFVEIGAGNVANQRNDGLQTDITLPAEAKGADTIDFRIFATGGGIEWTNFRINGEIAPIPEPSSLILLGLGAATVFRRRRSHLSV